MAAVSAVSAVSSVSNMAVNSHRMRASTCDGFARQPNSRQRRSLSAVTPAPCGFLSAPSALAPSALARADPRLLRKARHTAAAAAEGQPAVTTDAKEGEEVPVPVVVIDNHSEENATVVELEFGDRLGALMDTMAALRSLGLNVVKGRVTTIGNVARNKFTITQEGGKVERAEMIEAIRGTIISNLLKYHPESGSQLAMGLTCDSPPCNPGIPTRLSLTPLPDATGSKLRVEAADRPGLLMEIVDVLGGMSVSVTSAEIDTEGVVAKDVFTVSYHGGPLDEEMTTLTLNALNYTLSRPDIEAEESY
ncbi:hypothetical protein CLOP_g8637 [Closterium sp. NIES-67]|nr:hypothetical protein CLOP_g2167 [Closterium sp. NIES-67]GJP78313.1 hypothetical protein CLOP_g8637 [Closterium sp. NIES-67]